MKAVNVVIMFLFMAGVLSACSQSPNGNGEAEQPAASQEMAAQQTAMQPATMQPSVETGDAGTGDSSLKAVRDRYAEILSRKKYKNKKGDFEGCHFAIFDMDFNGIPELAIWEEGFLMSGTEYFTYENGDVVKLTGPKGDEEYPADGGLYLSPERKRYAYMRGGTMETAWNLIMEYKIKDRKIVLDTSWYGEWEDKLFGEKNLRLTRDRQKITKEEYMQVYRSYENNLVEFVPNTEENRRGIN